MPCRKGQRHSGHFKKGHDPRRHVTGPYMQKKRISIEMVCQEKAEKALETLMKVIEDDDAPAKDRVNAANSLLDRAFGKSVDRVQVAQIKDGGGSGAVLTRDELMLRLTQRCQDEGLDNGKAMYQGEALDERHQGEALGQRYTEDAVDGEALDADFEEVPEDAPEPMERVITG